jgi:hypothetical protein
LLVKYLQKFDVEGFGNELIENLDYVTDDEIRQLQHKAQQIRGICRAAIKYKRKSQEADIRRRQRKSVKEVEIISATAIATNENNKSVTNQATT